MCAGGRGARTAHSARAAGVRACSALARPRTLLRALSATAARLPRAARRAAARRTTGTSRRWSTCWRRAPTRARSTWCGARAGRMHAAGARATRLRRVRAGACGPARAGAQRPCPCRVHAPRAPSPSRPRPAVSGRQHCAALGRDARPRGGGARARRGGRAARRDQQAGQDAARPVRPPGGVGRRAVLRNGPRRAVLHALTLRDARGAPGCPEQGRAAPLLVTRVCAPPLVRVRARSGACRGASRARCWRRRDGSISRAKGTRRLDTLYKQFFLLGLQLVLLGGASTNRRSAAQGRTQGSDAGGLQSANAARQRRGTWAGW